MLVWRLMAIVFCDDRPRLAAILALGKRGLVQDDKLPVRRSVAVQPTNDWRPTTTSSIRPVLSSPAGR
jgi:hypothetical protein